MPYDLLVIGLGNFGSQYENTRHNVGFSALDILCQENNLEWNKNIFDNFLHQTIEETVLIKPLTYMNRSGLIIDKLKKKFIKKHTKIVVVCDNLDIKSPRIRLKQRGNKSSQKGLQSIIENLDLDFFCLFIGISKPPIGVSTADYVLSKPYQKAEIESINLGIKKSVELIKRIPNEDIELLMNEFNKK